MDGARNLLLGTCKERNLRKKDLNVEDENLSFVLTYGNYDVPGTPGTGGWWKAYNSDNPEDRFTLSDIGYNVTMHDGGYSYLRPRIYGLNQVAVMLHNHENVTGELYVRLMVTFPANGYLSKAEAVALSLHDEKTNETTFKISTLGIDGWDKHWGFKVSWIGADGLEHTISTPLTDRLHAENLFDVKVFIPKEGIPKLLVVQVATAKSYSYSYDKTTGFKDSAGVKRIALWSDDNGQTHHGYSTIGYSRIGIGNKITTALP